MNVVCPPLKVSNLSILIKMNVVCPPLSHTKLNAKRINSIALKLTICIERLTN